MKKENISDVKDTMKLWEKEKIISDLIHSLISNSVLSFPPSLFFDKANIAFEDTLDILLNFVNSEKLILKMSTKCPRCNNVLDDLTPFKELVELKCSCCDLRFKTTKDNTYPILYVDEKYRKHVVNQRSEERCNSSNNTITALEKEVGF